MSASTAVHTIDGLTPGSTLRPETAEELAEALRAADADGHAVAPIGGGTHLHLGNRPRRLDLVLQTEGLNRVVEYEPADLTVTVEAGMRFGELQALLGGHGQLLALDPPVAPEATIGGVIATNASGPLRCAFGTARDLVIGTRVANPDGTLTRAGGRVVKNVAGYDLNKLYVGSLGTLAVIVELSFKLAPIPPAVATVVGRFASLEEARSVVAYVVRSPLSPLAVELLGSGAAAASSLESATHVAFRVGGYPQAVDRQIRELRSAIGSSGGMAVDAASDPWSALEKMRQATQQRQVVLKAAAPIAESARLVDLMQQRLAGLQPVVWAHAANGIAYAACDAPADAAPLLQLRAEVGQLGSNASLVMQRLPLELKSGLDVWGHPGASLALMRALKEKLDPRGTLNPGRYVGGL